MIQDGTVAQYLVVAIMGLALCQNKKRRNAALIFAVFTLGHDMFLSGLEGQAYFATAALLDVFIIVLTASLVTTVGLVSELHRICGASIVFNAAGWATWMRYTDLTGYAVAYVLLYSWAIFILIKDDGVPDKKYLTFKPFTI